MSIFPEVSLGEICEFQNGRAFKKTEWRTSGLPIIRIQNLNNRDAEFNYYEGEYDRKIEVNDGDLLFSWSGTVGSSFGPHLWNRGKGVLNQHIFKVSLSAEIDRVYAFHVLRFVTAEIEKNVKGAVGLRHVTKSDLIKFRIPLPDLKAQKRIVAILDEAFAGINMAIANAEKSLANARELFESYLDNLVISNEDGWQKCILRDVLHGQPRNGWSPPAKNHSDSGVPVLTLSSVTGFNFNGGKVKYTSAETDEGAHYWIGNGDLLITRSNTAELVGHVAIVDKVVAPTIYPDLIMRMKVDTSRCLTKFLYFQLRSRTLRDVISNVSHGANPTMRKINKTDVQNLPVWLPELGKQKEIVDSIELIIEQVEAVKRVYRNKLLSLYELKQSLLQKAFSGELTAEPDALKEEAIA